MPASSFTNFKLTLKTATLLALVTVKHCSNLTLLHVHNQHLFQYHVAIFLPASTGKMDQLGNLLPQICMEPHSSVNLCPVFYLKAYLCHSEPFRNKSDGSQVPSLHLETIGSTCQYGPKQFLLR